MAERNIMTGARAWELLGTLFDLPKNVLRATVVFAPNRVFYVECEIALVGDITSIDEKVQSVKKRFKIVEADEEDSPA